MQQIEALRQEIQSYEDEIRKLQQELAAAGGRTLELATSADPSSIATAVREQAQQVIEQQPVLKGLKDAIAELSSRLQQKKAQLQELETAELKRQQLQRVEEGRAKLREKFTDVERVAEALKNLFFELKTLAREYEADFSQIHPPSSGQRQLNRAALLNYEALLLPQIAEVGDRFVLGSKAIDIFEAEKKAFQQQRLEQSLVRRRNHEQQMTEIRERQAALQAQEEKKQLQAKLSAKQSELKGITARRAEFKSWGGSMNLSGFDHAIAELEKEIASLEESV